MARFPGDPGSRSSTARLRRGRTGGLVALFVVVTVLAGLRPATAGVSGCSRDGSWAQIESLLAAEVLTLTNAHRAGLGLDPLKPSSSLTAAAEWKAAHMANFGYFAHDDPAPPVDRGWYERLQACGYKHGAGENIAYGYKTPVLVVQGWLDSDGHRRNIENESYKVIGIGVAMDDEGRPYWVQDFGTRADSNTTVPEPEPEPTEAESPEPEPDTSEEPDVNVFPVAADDVRTARPRRTIVVRALSNDFDSDGDTLVLESVDDATRFGTVWVDPAAGSVTYRARRGTAGRTELLNYSVADGRGGADHGQIRIRIRRARR